MRPASRSAAVAVAVALMLGGCGTGLAGWQPVGGQATVAGLLIRVETTAVADTVQPWRRPPAGDHCVVYTIQVRAVDGRRHELRPDAFEAGGATATDALGYCNAPQLEPTWIGTEARTLQLTILEPTQEPQPLLVRG
jgi:hypothetical protein